MTSTWNKSAFRSILKHIGMVILFLAFLLGIRWLWYSVHATPEHPFVSQGVIDLRGWDFEKSRSIPLDGEWEFYPEALITHGDTTNESRYTTNYIQVPGDWRSGFSPRNDSSYGYGTYRLRILVDQHSKQSYAFWIQQIEASSVVEINGNRDAAIGVVGEQASEYKPRVVSYTASYTAKEATEVEVLVQVANFHHPFKGGIMKSIRFGSQAAIDNERMYSIGFQLTTFLILLLHGLYAGILYSFNPRNKGFLVFFLLLLSVSISIVADHDNILLIWLPLDYSWALKVKMLSYVWLSFLILLMARYLSGPVPGRKVFPIFLFLLCLYTVFVLVAPVQLIYLTTAAKLFAIFYLLPVAWFVYLIGKMVVTNQHDAVFLLFAATSILSSVLWGAFTYSFEKDNIYYPIDVIAAIVGFSAYWFKRYFRNSEENAKLNEHLKKSDKLKDQFLAHTSHELRTPLHGIMNIAQSVVTSEAHAMDRRSAEDMELLITISRRMSHLLDDLLDVVRLQDKHIKLKKEPLSLQSVASGVISMLKYLVDGKSIEVKRDIPDSLPPVLADEKRLIQILFNLLHNALKFTEEGTIVISAKAKKGYAVIQVSDTGIGMDVETQKRIFLPYEQGSHGMSEGGGIGLGLSICKQLVELHNGELTVQSERGKGSTFSFQLAFAAPESRAAVKSPVYEEQVRADHITPDNLLRMDGTGSMWSALHEAAPAIAERKPNILAIDDDPVNLKVIESILSPSAYNICTSTSVKEALGLLGKQQWDLLIIDVMMPHMSGYELTKKVREHFNISELPILLLTARSQPEDVYTGFSSGANDYVTKPVDAMELKYRVWSLTTLKQTINERLRMEAAYLQAQIHPHFLFNTLSSIMALSDIDTEKMRRLGDAFTSYLHISFDFLNSGEHISLAHELELVQAYLYIETERFPDRLAVEWDVDPDPEITLRIPPLTIQPLVENAVKHGLLSQMQGGTVLIRIARQQSSTLFEVKDNGKGMSAETVQLLFGQEMRAKGGIGVSNTNRRLIQMYGRGLSIQSKLGEGTTVSFVIPDRE
ncbi:ATP-binding response regulator [Brevibacillus reuszeri]|uniref:ATP-binding response regulator n=1 Tax=Brevibacillus reuszeri TaxID=54915 RepID=UPI001BB31C3F|nr:ATP-binding protein [Brevibacillus reuszeri]